MKLIWNGTPEERLELLVAVQRNCMCTIDVHARDVVQRLIDERVDSAQCFQWQSQLRYFQNEKTKECQVRGSLCIKKNARI